eukprot:SAG31_NODE_444_length_15625_cov_6.047469_5_plen_194_part_00
MARPASFCSSNYSPKFKGQEAGGSNFAMDEDRAKMVAMMMHPENRRTVERMFDGLTDISASDGQLYSTDDVVYPSGGGGLVSTTHDYVRFCLMLANAGELDGVRVLSSKTLAYMTANHLPDNKDMRQMYKQKAYSEVQGAGAGFGLGFSTVLDPVSYGEWRLKFQNHGSMGSRSLFVYLFVSSICLPLLVSGA